MYKEVYIDMLARIADKLPEIKFVDIYNGQYLDERPQDPFARPALFIEFMPSEWEQLGKREQQSQHYFALHIVSDEVLQESSTESSPLVRAAALAHLDLIDKVQLHFQGWSAGNLASLTRAAFSSGSPVKGLYIHIPVYAGNLVDAAGRRPYTMIPVNPGIITATIEEV